MLDPKCIYQKIIFAKCTRLACLLSFASLFLYLYWCLFQSAHTNFLAPVLFNPYSYIQNGRPSALLCFIDWKGHFD